MGTSGGNRFTLNSSLGANLGGNFHLRTKAEAERAVRTVAYPSYTMVRPSLIDADRTEPQFGERVRLLVAKAFRPVIPPNYRLAKAAAIAVALLESIIEARPGEHIVESEGLA